MLQVVAFLLPLVLVIAAVFDLTAMRLPNYLNVAIAAMFLPVAVFAKFSIGDVAWHFIGSAIVLALCFGMFALNLIGGGDAKFATAIALWIEPGHLLIFGFWTAVFGGLLTLVLMLFRTLPVGSVLARSPWLARLHSWKSGVPYGIALAAAALQVYPHTEIFAGLGGPELLNALYTSH